MRPQELRYEVYGTNMDELSPKEQYEQKKKEKLAVEVRNRNVSKVKSVLILALIAIAIFGGVYWLIGKNRQTTGEKKIYAVQISDQGRAHIDVGAPHPEYNSNPPTSGWHYEKEADKGVSKKQLPDEQLIHNLEHGYIWISYRPDAASEVVKQLENFYGFGKKIIVEPRKENDKLIAIAAWNWLDKFDPSSSDSLDDAELKRIGDFIDKYINQGPEPNAP